MIITWQYRDRKPPCEGGEEGKGGGQEQARGKVMERPHTHTAAMVGVGNGDQRPWRRSKANPVEHKVFLGGLDRSSTGNSIMSYFSSFGETLDH
jgi:hypothetical protein